MKSAVAALLLITLAVASAQTYGGINYKYNADIKKQVDGDIQQTTGSTKVATSGDTLYYYSTLNNAADITLVQIHLSPTPGAVNAGPLLLTLTNTTAANGATPLSSPAGGPLVQVGTRNTANLLANPMLPMARAQLASLGVTDNNIQNIGDIERLLARGLCYSDVHSITRPPPQRVGSGLFFQVPPGTGRKLSSFY